LVPLIVLQDDGILGTALGSLKEPTIIHGVRIGNYSFVGLVEPENRGRQNHAISQPAAEISIYAYLHLDSL
jgi:hypothetical protein